MCTEERKFINSKTLAGHDINYGLRKKSIRIFRPTEYQCGTVIDVFFNKFQVVEDGWGCFFFNFWFSVEKIFVVSP